MHDDRGDLFGLNREAKIIAAKVREVYTPHRPVNSQELFFGRQQEVQSLIEQINTPGQHSLLYGERGVGKSSLAAIASDILLKRLIKGELFYERSDSHSTFASLLQRPLATVGVDLGIVESATKTTSGGSAKLKTPIAEAGGGLQTERSETRRGQADRISPSEAAARLTNLRGLLVVDEADVVSRDDMRLLSEFVKQLSDRDARFKVMIVGVAETGEELTAGHPSVGRCLRETKLRRMPADELALIISGGAAKLRLLFEKNAIDSIVAVSAGYPHFTQLMALKCAENAVAEDRRRISPHHLTAALQQATRDAEGSLRRVYAAAVRSHTTDMFKTVVRAAATLPTEEFKATELRQAIEKLTGTAISQYSLNNYLTRLVADDGSTIIRRIAKGVYRFTDPRMPSFVKIANAAVA